MKTTIERFKDIQAEGLVLFERKNADYGDSFREDGVLGVMVRMKDKLSRLIHLARTGGETAVKEERTRETLLDFHNYSGMAVDALDNGAVLEDRKKVGTITLVVTGVNLMDDAAVDMFMKRINERAQEHEIKIMTSGPKDKGPEEPTL